MDYQNHWSVFSLKCLFVIPYAAVHCPSVPSCAGRRKPQPLWNLPADVTSMLIKCTSKLGGYSPRTYTHRRCTHAPLWSSILLQTTSRLDTNSLLNDWCSPLHSVSPAPLRQLSGCRQAVAGSRRRSRADCRALWLTLLRKQVGLLSQRGSVTKLQVFWWSGKATSMALQALESNRAVT